MQNVTIATEAPDLLELAVLACEKLGKPTVAEKLDISIQALNRVLQPTSDPWYRLQRRLEIIALCFDIKAGPIFTITMDEELASRLQENQVQK